MSPTHSSAASSRPWCRRGRSENRLTPLRVQIPHACMRVGTRYKADGKPCGAEDGHKRHLSRFSLCSARLCSGRPAMGNGHWQLEGSAAGERTPGANAFVLALDEVLGTGASCIKRGEHSFADPARLEALLKGARFGAVEVQTVCAEDRFPVRARLREVPTLRHVHDCLAEAARTASTYRIGRVQDHSVVDPRDARRRQICISTGGVCRRRT